MSKSVMAPWAQRSHGDDVTGGASGWPPRIFAHSQDLLGPGVEGNHRRLVEDDPTPPRIDERIGGAEVDGEVLATSSLFHPGHGRGPRPRADSCSYLVQPTSAAVSVQVASIRMESGGSFPFGEIPDESDGPGEEESLPRGWIAPEDRLWRHPSELAHQARAVSSHLLSGRGRRWREPARADRRGHPRCSRRGYRRGGGSRVRNAPVSGTDGPVHVTVTSSVVPSVSLGMTQVAAALRPSLVELEPVGTGRRSITGVVLPGAPSHRHLRICRCRRKDGGSGHLRR